MTTPSRLKRPFSPGEKAVVIVQLVIALSVGVAAMLDANDPDWGDLQRVVVLMLMSIWLGGIVASVVLARIFDSKPGRVAILVLLPFSGFAVLAAWTLLSI